MTIDLHPEELLDKAAAGTLSASERTWLDDHLARCHVCRFEQQARLDFAEAPIAAIDTSQLVARALSGLPVANAVSPKRLPRFQPWVAAAVVLTTFGSFAAVGQLTGALPALLAAISAPEPEGVVPSPAPEVVRPRPMPTVTEPSATELFALGNRARSRGAHAEALGHYRTLLAKHAGTPEAALSDATVGRMLLDDGDARGALVHLDRYLKSADPSLHEESLAARALALQQLGEAAAEARAWRALLAEHPASLHEARALARLEVLGAR